jgi:hypothetical protein
MQLVIGSIVARCSTPYIPLGVLVGVSDCGMLATVDTTFDGARSSFPGSMFSRPLMREITALVPTDLCRECCGGCRYGCEAADDYAALKAEGTVFVPEVAERYEDCDAGLCEHDSCARAAQIAGDLRADALRPQDDWFTSTEKGV